MNASEAGPAHRGGYRIWLARHVILAINAAVLLAFCT